MPDNPQLAAAKRAVSAVDTFSTVTPHTVCVGAPAPSAATHSHGASVPRPQPPHRAPPDAARLPNSGGAGAVAAAPASHVYQGGGFAGAGSAPAPQPVGNGFVSFNDGAPNCDHDDALGSAMRSFGGGRGAGAGAGAFDDEDDEDLFPHYSPPIAARGRGRGGRGGGAAGRGRGGGRQGWSSRPNPWGAGFVKVYTDAKGRVLTGSQAFAAGQRRASCLNHDNFLYYAHA